MSADVSSVVENLVAGPEPRLSLDAERRLFSLSADLLCVVGPTGSFEHLSPSWEQLLGWDIETLKSRPLIDLIYENDRAEMTAHLLGLSGSSETLPLEFRTRCLRSDGTYSWLAWRAIRARDGRIYGSARDATAEVEVAAGRSLLATIVDSSFDPIVSLALDGTITSWNDAAANLYGWSGVEAIGQHVSLIHPDRAEMDGLIQTAISRQVSRLETLRMTRSGVSVKVLVTMSPILGGDGTVIGVSSISTNIAEHLKSEAESERLNDELEARVDSRTRELRERTLELERSISELDSFTYSVSHDLRAPLRAMDGFSRIVLDELGSKVDPETRRHLEIIRKNAQSMQQLIDGLLDLCRVSRRPFEPVELAPAVVARRALDDLGELAERSDVDITIDDLPNCTADPILLKQVFVNLLGNALKFTSKTSGARIQVGAQRDGPGIVYFVKDNGAGFDPRYIEKIFGVFQRLHRVEDFEGTGIGLALVQRVVEKHGGRIWCEGSVGHGATFYFTLGEKVTP